MDNNVKKCGFISIIGATNSGKSTLMNTILGIHASIVSHKVQTTRNTIRGIKNYGNTQLIFIDTPGIFNAVNKFDKAIVKSATDSIIDCDIILFVIDAVRGINKSVLSIIDKLKNIDRFKNQNLKICAILNKVDLVHKVKLLDLASKLNALFSFDNIFMISAYKNDRVEDVVKTCVDYSPKSNWFYNNEVLDIPDNVYYAEITREQIYKFLHKELPYDISVITESIKYDSDNILEIRQIIYVSRIGQRKIVIGDKAEIVKLIGSRSRKMLQNITGQKVRLFLTVKVQSDWKNKKEFYDELGLEFPFTEEK